MCISLGYSQSVVKLSSLRSMGEVHFIAFPASGGPQHSLASDTSNVIEGREGDGGFWMLNLPSSSPFKVPFQLH
jgi:hypothetical protein